MNRSVVVVVAAVIGVLFALPTPGALSVVPDNQPPEVRAVRVDKAAVSPSGLATRPVEIQLDIRDVGSGVYTGGSEGAGCFYSPMVALNRVSGSNVGGPLADTRTSVILHRVAGTDMDGTWAGTWPVPSTYNGTWRLSICVMDEAGNVATIDTDRSVVVTGSHQPLISMVFTPNPLHRGDALNTHGTVIDTATGAGMANVPVVLGRDNTCGADSWGGSEPIRTSAAGTWSRVQPNAAPGVYDNTCAMINLPGGQSINKYPYPTSNDQVAAIVGGEVRVVFDVMSAQPAATHVRHGTNVAVDGAVWPARVYGRVLLQRLVSSSWRTVNSGGVRESGRYTVIATPPTAGNHQYRVVRPSDYCTNGVCRYIGDVSPTFTITAT